MTPELILEEGTRELGLVLPDGASEKFAAFAKRLVEVNEVMNLTAITDTEQIYIKHFIDSLTPLILPVFREGARVADVGSGAGFPGIPMKTARPDLEITMLDALNKRVEFLKDTVGRLGLEGVECVHARAEEFAALPERREKYDAAISRAVADLPALCELCLPLVRVGGHFVAMKGPEPDEEIKRAQRAIDTLGGRLAEVVPAALPDGSGRALVVIEKIRPTGGKYPRPFAKIKKSPL